MEKERAGGNRKIRDYKTRKKHGKRWIKKEVRKLKQLRVTCDADHGYK
jgi:hypothetical protein